jgi:hypothetical protein
MILSRAISLAERETGKFLLYAQPLGEVFRFAKATGKFEKALWLSRFSTVWSMTH